ncbi:MAG: hypothetical protein SWO11_17005 [Thermodesulfobacteriota bacterium]|nr:hypothetical protein [Thermodesulfobacteriota bacterium]
MKGWAIKIDDNGNLEIDGKLFEVVGEGFPEEDEFGSLFICHNYQAEDDVMAKSWHPVTDINAFEEGDFDCCEWDNFNTAKVVIID